MEQKRNVFLIGFMGCGKSTVAACINQIYGMPVIEMDQVIAERQQMSIPQIFEHYGEQYFRDLESSLLQEIQLCDNQVVSCGGGVVLRERNVAEMKKKGYIVLLTAKPETILKRVKENDDRPILRGKKNVEDIANLLEQRHDKYVAASDIIVSTDQKNVCEIAEEIMQRIGEKSC